MPAHTYVLITILLLSRDQTSCSMPADTVMLNNKVLAALLGMMEPDG